MHRLIGIGVLVVLTSGCATSGGSEAGPSTEKTTQTDETESTQSGTLENDDADTTVTPGGGTIDARAAFGVFRRHRDAVTECYRKAVKEKPDLSAHMTIHLEVGVEGNPRDIRTTTPGGEYPMLTDCVTDEVMSWSFPKPEGGPVTIQKPYQFDTEQDPRPSKP